MREKNCSDRFIKWFFSYLSGRSQAVLDMRGLLSECMLFADDLQVYLQCKRKDILVIVQRLSSEAENVADWAARYDLDLNFSKIVAIIFGSD